MEAKFNLTKINHLFYVFCCFPWVSFSILGSDSQPWYTILGIIIIISNSNIIITKPIIYALFSTIIGVLIAIFFNQNLPILVLKNIYNFSSFYVVLIVSFTLLKKQLSKELVTNIFRISNYIYIFFAFVQIISPGLIKFICNFQTSSDRGLTSLTPEPGYFGMYLIFSSMIILCLNNFSFKRNLSLHYMNLFSIVFLALSTMNTLYLIIFLLSFLFFKLIKLKAYKSYIFILLSLIVLIFSIIFFDDQLSNFRIYTIGKILFNNPYNLLSDISSFRRISDIIYPIQFSMQNLLFPQGLSGLLFKNDLFLEDRFFSSGNGILLSWTASWIFSLGIFGLFALSLLFKETIKYAYSFRNYFIIFCFFLFLFQSVPLSSPFAAILFSILMQEKSNFQSKAIS